MGLGLPSYKAFNFYIFNAKSQPSGRQFLNGFEMSKQLIPLFPSMPKLQDRLDFRLPVNQDLDCLLSQEPGFWGGKGKLLARVPA
jgi:hypothetical protein